MAKPSPKPSAPSPFADLVRSPAVQDLARRVESGGVSALTGLSPAAQAFLGALLHHGQPGRPVVVVVDTLKTQEQFEQDINTWLTALRPPATGDAPTVTPCLFHPGWDVLPGESRLPHADVISDRLQTLMALAVSESAPLIVTNVNALQQLTFSPQTLRERTRTLRRGDRIEPMELAEWLDAQGYEAVGKVTQRGELSLRGGILDAWALTAAWPVRLEFFGNALDSLRRFDPLTQISTETITEVMLGPGGELGVLRRAIEEGDQGQMIASLVEHLPANTLWLLCEPDELTDRAQDFLGVATTAHPLMDSWDEVRSRITGKGQRVLELLGDELDRSGVSAERRHSLPDEESGALARRCYAEDASPPLDPGLISLDAYRPLAAHAPDVQVAEAQRREFFEQLHRWIRQRLSVHVFCNNDGERQRFEEVWAEHGFASLQRSYRGPRSSGRESAPSLRNESERRLTSAATGREHTPVGESGPAPVTHLGSLSRGFLWEQAGLVVVTDAEVFGRYKVQRPRRLKAAHAQTTRSALEIDFTELDEGDYVVHLQHGIGRYVGLQRAPSAPVSHTNRRAPEAAPECLVIEYAPGDPDQPAPRLYVPVSEAHLVSKYVGAGKARPPLNALGGTRWKKAKEQAEQAVRDVAAELLLIQAARESQPGYAFGADTHWQHEFEASFLFVETPDQVRAIGDTKVDMERARPMDRLVCGDVGFGKTEVAIRAAFKAVMGGKQVAVLVPTTVLAQQHFNTFRERMADYPVRIELLSRFRSRREQQKVVRELALGSVDIVVGTHRLVQTDIAFKDLGLVVVDEEQRFGVLHKERLKRLRTMVDVLTLSATPIPRTLYLALSGARDMSTIQTPPQDRLPVETIVAAYDERLIRDAIQRELNRGGQVFFLHNRVMTIETMARKLENLVPHARIVVGHGQMDADDLEWVMTRFVNGDADILLSTTIIESGLDIPNANTIIIDRADRFGLSDLYQLRGRVGRYKHQAYAYLLIPRHAGLLSEARKRIGAIRQYATLGSGFKIAMRDLEIRGAGNLLGAQQSGHITAVGFDLYCQLLKQSVASLKGEKIQPRVTVEVSLDFLTIGADVAASDRPRARPSSSTVATGTTEDEDEGRERGRTHFGVTEASASLPMRYIPEAGHRIEIYRKLAECTDLAGVKALEAELADRFGPPPLPVQLLLQLTALKVLAAERGVTRMEVEDDRLKLTRNGDYVQAGGRFPRLTGTSASARLKEIRRLLLSLGG